MNRLPDLESSVLSYNQIDLHINKIDFWSSKLRLQNDNWLFNVWQSAWTYVGLNNQCVLLDIGANYGVASWEFFKKGFCKKTIMFEPIIENCECISRTFTNSNLDWSLHNCAVGDTCGEIGFLWNKSQTGTSKIVDSLQSNRIVNIQTLDSMNWTQVDIIKIDVEGHELAVLKGAQNLLVEFEPVVFFEANHKTQEQLDQTQQVIDWLASKNYICLTSSLHQIQTQEHLQLANLASNSIIHSARDLLAIPQTRAQSLKLNTVDSLIIKRQMIDKQGKNITWHNNVPWKLLSPKQSTSLNMNLIENQITHTSKSNRIFTLIDGKPYESQKFFQQFDCEKISQDIDFNPEIFRF
jgi:FkbM family methyltransferase